MNMARSLLTSTTQSTNEPHLHQPERGDDETFVAYKARRAASNKAAKAVLRGVVVYPVAGKNRRHHLKAAGGIRQFKRVQYLAQHDGYAARHPGVAASAYRA